MSPFDSLHPEQPVSGQLPGCKTRKEQGHRSERSHPVLSFWARFHIVRRQPHGFGCFHELPDSRDSCGIMFKKANSLIIASFVCFTAPVVAMIAMNREDARPYLFVDGATARGHVVYLFAPG
jgi:hypothetical protein